MLCCKEVAAIVASDEMGDLSWLKRLELRMHLMMCRLCRRYETQIRAIGNIYREMWQSRREDPATLERLESRILEDAFGGGDSGSAGKRDPF